MEGNIDRFYIIRNGSTEYLVSAWSQESAMNVVKEEINQEKSTHIEFIGNRTGHWGILTHRTTGNIFDGLTMNAQVDEPEIPVDEDGTEKEII